MLSELKRIWVSSLVFAEVFMLFKHVLHGFGQELTEEFFCLLPKISIQEIYTCLI
jgi:hypothetical protein